jgi:hypothetical protein
MEVYKQVKKDLIRLVIIAIVVSSLHGYFKDKDDTDPENGRSGLMLFTDAKTGCQYVGNPAGGIIPRMNEEGHIGGFCNKSWYDKYDR